jgi:hypothetical protein
MYFVNSERLRLLGTGRDGYRSLPAGWVPCLPHLRPHHREASVAFPLSEDDLRCHPVEGVKGVRSLRHRSTAARNLRTIHLLLKPNDLDLSAIS